MIRGFFFGVLAFWVLYSVAYGLATVEQAFFLSQ